MPLISECLCGLPAASSGLPYTVNGVEVATCPCGVTHSTAEGDPRELERWYEGGYHRAIDRHADMVPYARRFADDYALAGVRWNRYRELLGAHAINGLRTALDVGTAHGAFVAYLRGQGVEAWGVDPDPVNPGPFVHRGRVRDAWGRYGLITYHDVLEHLADPIAELRRVAGRRMTLRSLLVIEVPDVSIPEGQHHFKREHLWYFTPASLELILELAGCTLELLDRPIAGKLVAFARLE